MFPAPQEVDVHRSSPSYPHPVLAASSTWSSSAVHSRAPGETQNSSASAQLRRPEQPPSPRSDSPQISGDPCVTALFHPSSSHELDEEDSNADVSSLPEGSGNSASMTDCLSAQQRVGCSVGDSAHPDADDFALFPGTSSKFPTAGPHDVELHKSVPSYPHPVAAVSSTRSSSAVQSRAPGKVQNSSASSHVRSPEQLPRPRSDSPHTSAEPKDSELVQPSPSHDAVDNPSATTGASVGASEVEIVLLSAQHVAAMAVNGSAQILAPAAAPSLMFLAQKKPSSFWQAAGTS